MVVSDIETAWNNHLTFTTIPQVLSSFSDNATLLYSPTGAGGSGISEIKRFLEYTETIGSLLEPGTQHRLISRYFVKEKTTVIDTVVLSIDHNRNVNWLLPGVEATGKKIEFIVTIFAEFDADAKIIKKTLFWDQACVLKQLDLLPHHIDAQNQLPVVGADSVKRLTDPSTVRFNPLTKAFGAFCDSPIINEHVPKKRNHTSNIIFGDAEPEKVRPSTRLFGQSPGGQQSHNIFDLGDSPPTSNGKKLDPTRNSSHFNICEEERQVQKPLIRGPIEALRKNISTHFKISDDVVDSVPPETRRHTDPNKSHFTLGETPAEECPTTKSGKKLSVKSDHHFSLNSDETYHEPIRGVRRKTNPNASQIMMGSCPDAPPTFRASSRVLCPPGGGSSIVL